MTNDRLISDLDKSLQILANQFLSSCHAAGLTVFIIQTYRSKEEQDADYAQGRTSPGKIITNAKGGESPHNCTLPDGTPASKAFDFGCLDGNGKYISNGDDPAYVLAANIGESVGLVSGRTFPFRDCDHLELPNWRSDAMV